MKAILIIDMPKSCEDCELCDGTYDYICLRLGEVDESVENGTKDLRCPLKPMPERKRKIKELPQYTKEYETYCKGEVDGWNFCLDEILGEEE